MRPPRVLTWHVHGSYLYYLSHAKAEFYLPVKPGRPEGYGGRSGSFPWPDNVHEIAAQDVAGAEFDCVLFQSHRNWNVDRHEILGVRQRHLPRVFLEHDPPRESPTDTPHPVDDPGVLLVHVTGFNQLMWDARSTPTTVVEHGVVDTGVQYTGELERGIAVVNNLSKRGRRLGADVFAAVRAEVPIDLAGMGSNELGGLGDIPITQLWHTAGRYRFFFNPIRYTSLGLAVCEAMMAGLPVVALATTEMATVIENGRNGYADTRPAQLVARMQELFRSPQLAAELGRGARETAQERFGIERFASDWEDVFARVTGGTRNLFPVAGAVGGSG